MIGMGDTSRSAGGVGTRARNIRVKVIYATILEPVPARDGTSLEEKLNAWLESAGEIELIDYALRPVGVTSTAIIILYAL